jgi:hypothetical protein
MKTLAPAAWVAILVTVAAIAGCVAMVYIAQDNSWSSLDSGIKVETDK